MPRWMLGVTCSHSAPTSRRGADSADLMEEFGRSAEAAEHLSAAVAISPNDPTLCRRLAQHLAKLDDARGEAEAWKHLLQLVDDLEAHVRLAKLLPLLGRSEEAVAHLRVLAETEPHKISRWKQLGKLAQQVANHEVATLAGVGCSRSRKSRRFIDTWPNCFRLSGDWMSRRTSACSGCYIAG